MTDSKASMLMRWKIASRKIPALFTISIEPAVGVDRHLDDFARWQSFRNGFEIRDRSSPALLDLVDDFFGGCGVIARTVCGYAGIIYDNFGTLCGTEKCYLTADAAPRARDDDDFVA